MMPNEFLKSSLPLVQMARGEKIVLGYLPPPDCDLVLDFRGANSQEQAWRSTVVASLHCSAETQEIYLKPEVESTKIIIDGREVDYTCEELNCPPGSVLTFGKAPYEMSFLLVPAVDPLAPGPFGPGQLSTCILGEAPLHLVPPLEPAALPEPDSWVWVHRGMDRGTPSPSPKAVESPPVKIPPKKAPAKTSKTAVDPGAKAPKAQRRTDVAEGGVGVRPPAALKAHKAALKEGGNGGAGEQKKPKTQKKK